MSTHMSAERESQDREPQEDDADVAMDIGIGAASDKERIVNVYLNPEAIGRYHRL